VIWAWVLVVRWLTWGLDLAGQAGDAERSRDREGAVGGLASAGGVASGGAIPGLQGAGGIGGLLAADDANGTPGVTGDDEQYVFFYDAQGNVGQLVKDAVQPLARYEYDAYGRTIGPDADGDGDWTDDAGPFATTNPYRFSTKPCDGALTYSEPAAPGLYYYGYRYYSPRLGRWLSREPLGEDASANLYTFANNAPLNWMDPDGMRAKPSQTTTQPTTQPDDEDKKVNNLDETTHIGRQLRPLVSKTKCGIFVVRATNAGGTGHTTVMWDQGAVGFVGGDKPRNDSDEIGNVNFKRRAISAYAVRYQGSSTFAPIGMGHGIVLENRYKAGPQAGKCCPATPNCDDIKACLNSLIGQPCGYDAAKDSNKKIDERYNCNSFAHEALSKCCLRPGALILDNYSARNYARSADSEASNMGWRWVWRRL